MKKSPHLPFGIQPDGSLDRRAFLLSAGQLGVGMMGMGAAPLLMAQQQNFTVGWVRPSTGRLASWVGRSCARRKTTRPRPPSSLPS